MTFYHGTSSALEVGDVLLPPNETGQIQELGRKKNLDRVFFTTDKGSARIYAGRAVNRFGGTPVVLEVMPLGPVVCLSDRPGTSVYHASAARVVT